MKAPRCISLGAGIQTPDYTILVGGCGLKYGAACVRRTKSRSGQRSEVSTPSLYIGPLAQTTSDNASKAVPSSKSDWNLSRHWADSASTAKKQFFFAITFGFSKTQESKFKKTRVCVCVCVCVCMCVCVLCVCVRVRVCVFMCCVHMCTCIYVHVGLLVSGKWLCWLLLVFSYAVCCKPMYASKKTCPNLLSSFSEVLIVHARTNYC